MKRGDFTPMHIVELIVPGSSLEKMDFPYPAALWEMESMIDSLKNCFFEATLSLNLFQQSMDATDPDPSYKEYQRRTSRLYELEEIVELEMGPSTDFFRTDIRLEAEARLKREEWQSGKFPSEFEHLVTFVYAKSFVSALDGFEKLLGVISITPGGRTQELKILHEELNATFPDLRGIRNSAQHHEDRVRSLGNRGKPLDLQPIKNGMVPEGLPVLALNNIHGSKFCTTMADGHYGEVDITPESVNKLGDILQRVLNAFDWSGPPRHLPGYGRL